MWGAPPYLLGLTFTLNCFLSLLLSPYFHGFAITVLHLDVWMGKRTCQTAMRIHNFSSCLPNRRVSEARAALMLPCASSLGFQLFCSPLPPLSLYAGASSLCTGHPAAAPPWLRQSWSTPRGTRGWGAGLRAVRQTSLLSPSSCHPSPITGASQGA